MFAEHRTLVVVPARGGSKGVPRKNIRPLCGRPLLAHTAELIASLPWVDRAVVSTDDDEIAAVAQACGLAAPFVRPAELSGDRIGDVPVLEHALRATEAADGCRYDLVVMLQPTSPLRLPQHVTAVVTRLVQEGFDAVWTVSPTDLKYHPLKTLTLDAAGTLRLADPAGGGIIARQQLTPVYHRNGAAYALTRACLLEQGALMGTRTGAVVVHEPMVSIDTLEDFERVEAALYTRQRAARPGGRTLVVDIDGVIATLVPDNDYTKARPIPENIARVNALYDAGHHLVLYTARGSATGRDWREFTVAQMAQWGVRHHELRLGKPAADFYIDDRLLSLADAVSLLPTGPETAP